MLCMHEHAHTGRYFPPGVLSFVPNLALPLSLCLFIAVLITVSTSPLIALFCFVLFGVGSFFFCIFWNNCIYERGSGKGEEIGGEHMEERWWRREQLEPDQGNDAANFGGSEETAVPSPFLHVCVLPDLHVSVVSSLCMSLSLSITLSLISVFLSKCIMKFTSHETHCTCHISEVFSSIKHCINYAIFQEVQCIYACDFSSRPDIWEYLCK